MRYEELGRTGLKVSRLGFGCMRISMGQDGRVDRSIAIPLLQRAVELGVNYFDTAIGYCGGDSQRVLGEAMAGMRERVVISTKNHMHEAPAQAWQERLEESLRLLQTDYIDIYNFHGLTWECFQKNIAGPEGKLRLMERAMARGQVRHICCSFHDSPEALIKLLETGVFATVTIQYNLLWRDLEPAISRAHALGVGVVVMGPVAGGRLGVRSERVAELTRGAAASTPEAALRFVLANPGVTLALSGMSSMEMLEANAGIVSIKDPFTPCEIGTLDAEANRVRELQGVKCPACGYCRPCPAGVDIPGNFGIYNEYLIYGLADNARKAYASIGGHASKCIECGACLAKCPQKINIPAKLRDVSRSLDPDAGSVRASLTINGISGRNKLKCIFNAKNLSDTTSTYHAVITLEDNCSANPTSFEIAGLKSFSSHTRELLVAVADGSAALKGEYSIANPGMLKRKSFKLPFLIIPKTGTRLHTLNFSPCDFGGNEKFAGAHKLDIVLSRDSQQVVVELRVRSLLQGLGGAGESSGGRIEMYVDMRGHDCMSGNAYTDGAEQFFLCLGEAGLGSKSNKPYSCNLEHALDKSGCRLKLGLQFKDFGVADPASLDSIGLDFMMVAANAAGLEMGHPTYGGGQGLWQNPALFARAYFAE
ncbi:MAG: aldo/keto reductase [bacterium]